LIEDCKIASGIIFIWGSGGGSDEMKHLKFSWHVLDTSSRYPSSPLRPISQVCIRCTFCNITHVPLAAASNKAFFALFS